LSSFFTLPKTLQLGQIPGTIKLQSRSLSGQYVVFFQEKNNFLSTQVLSSEATNFYINLKPNSSAVEIMANNMYIQIDENYPYTARIGNKINDPKKIYQQEFYCDTFNNYVAIKTYTKNGFRYLAISNDGVLRATGVILNDQVVNDYFFNIVQNTANSLTYNFVPDNNWTTYFLDFPSQTYNKDISLNKVFSNIETNFLLDFPVENAVKSQYPDEEMLDSIEPIKDVSMPIMNPNDIEKEKFETTFKDVITKIVSDQLNKISSETTKKNIFSL
jgi:hypothetical protein